MFHSCRIILMNNLVLLHSRPRFALQDFMAFFFSPPPFKVCYYFCAALAVPCDGFFTFFHLISLVWSVCVSPFHLQLLSKGAAKYHKGTFHRPIKICHFYDIAEEEDAEEVPEFQVSGKIGAKKQRKLEEKQARKAQREVSISCHVESPEQSLNSSSQQSAGDDKHSRKAKAVSSWQCFCFKSVNSAFYVISQEAVENKPHFLSIRFSGIFLGKI